MKYILDNPKHAKTSVVDDAEVDDQIDFVVGPQAFDFLHPDSYRMLRIEWKTMGYLIGKFHIAAIGPFPWLPVLSFPQIEDEVYRTVDNISMPHHCRGYKQNISRLGRSFTKFPSPYRPNTTNPTALQLLL